MINSTPTTNPGRQSSCGEPKNRLKKVFPAAKCASLAKIIQARRAKLVVAGGCFDILHKGHLLFLQKAKEQGDLLLVLLEHDLTIKRLKGKNRPLNTGGKRASILQAVKEVDYIMTLPPHLTNQDYDRILLCLKPAIIATTKGDPNRIHKERQALKTGALVKDVCKRLRCYSTSKLITNKKL